MLSKKHILSPIHEVEYEDESAYQASPIQHFYNDNINPIASPISLKKDHRSVVINESQALARFSVLYLGTVISSSNQYGIDFVQEPLSKRYLVDGGEFVRGIEVWLSVNENDLQIQFVHDPSFILYYPIQSLVYCAGLRFATRSEKGENLPNGWRFVRLDSPEASQIDNIQNPPIFSVAFRRTRDSPIDEYHCFLTKTKQAALELVQACYDAYQATDSRQDCSKVPLYFKLDQSKIKEIDKEIRIAAAVDEEQELDYRTNTKCAGFFYKTDQTSIDYWKINEHQKPSAYRSLSHSHSYSVLPSNAAHRLRLSSITSASDIQPSSPEPEPKPTNNSLKQTIIAPYIPRTHNTSKAPEPIPRPQKVNNDIYVDLNNGYQVQQKIPDEILRFLFGNKYPFDNKSQHHKKKKSDKKQKHRNSGINNIVEDRHELTTDNNYNAIIPQQFYIPPYETSYHMIQHNPYLNPMF